MPRLHDDIKQSKPFPTPEDELFVQLLRTTDQLMHGLVAALKPSDLSPEQYNVLRILRGAGKDGHPCGEIAGRMITRDPDVTRLIDRLEKRGLVERRRDDVDRRVVRVTITNAGAKLIAPLDQQLIELHRAQLGHLGRRRIDDLIALLEAARHHD
ncbi:MAG TPA: MarR family transcriptional regulator [Planctomycetota bacterium]|nr:MarR family transcriptional regulator [Planctomycetota bacterium]